MHLRRAARLRIPAGVIIVSLIVCAVGWAQLSERVKSVSVPEGMEGRPIPVVLELVESAGVTQASLFYRPFGVSEFKQIEMTIRGMTAEAAIPGSDVIPASVEYYFTFTVRGKVGAESYPRENPSAQPLRVEVRAASEAEKLVIFLSPDAGSTVTDQDLFIAISLVRTDSTVRRSATKIFIDDRDVTSAAVFSEDLITLAPESVSPPLERGPHNLKVDLYGSDGKLVHTAAMNFSQISVAEAEAKAAEFKYNVSAQVESRHEVIDNSSTPYNRGTLNLATEYGILKVNGNMYLTNEDKSDRQPQNRYLLEAEIPWLRVAYGDDNPRFPDLIMSGERLRGLTTNLRLGFFNLDMATGEVVRKIEGDTLMTFPESLLVSVQRSDSLASYIVYDSTDPGKRVWAKIRTGTFRRDLTVIRPSFGSGESFQWGLSFLKAKDDAGSIAYGIKPQENLVLGSDIKFAFDDRHIEFTGQAAVSAYNRDISRGSLTDDQIDSLYTGSDSASKRSDLRNIRDKVANFITVNENLVPLSDKKLSSILSYDGGVSLNYFDNYLKASYLYRGSDYHSFGQNYLRQDVKGYNIYDRVRMLQNQLFASFGIEQLQDNTDDLREATTTFTNVNANLSYYPRMDFPSITVGYGRYSSDNGLAGTDTTVGAGDTSAAAVAARTHAKYLLASMVQDHTDRYFLQLGYDFTAGLRHSAMLGIGTTVRTDGSPYHLNQANTSISAALMTTWRIPLQTQVGFAVNLNSLTKISTDTTTTALQTESYSLNYTSITLGARYRMFEDKLTLNGSIGPTFGDVGRTIWDFGAEYKLMRDVIASTQLSVLQNTGASTDLIWSLMLRYNM
jgi:hypothetical protein